MLSLNDIEFARIVQIKYFHFCNLKSSSMIKCWCCCSQLLDISSDWCLSCHRSQGCSLNVLVSLSLFHFYNPLKSSSMAESAGPLAPCVHECTAQTRPKRRLRTLRKLLNDRERSSNFSATWRGLHLFPGPGTEPSHWLRGEGEIRGLPETLPETLV